MAIRAADLLVNVRADVDQAQRNLKRLDSTLDGMGKKTFPVAANAAKTFGLAAAAGFGVLATQAASAGIIQFTAALAPMVGATAALPGILLSAVGAFAALKVGLSGVGDAMKTVGGTAEEFAEGIKGLAPAAQEFMVALRGMREGFGQLRLDTQQALFAGLADSVRALGEAYLPTLSAALPAIAGDFGQVTRNFSAFLQQGKSVQDVATVLDGTRPIVAGLGEAVKDVTAAFLDLAVGGRTNMTNLGQGIADTAQRFREWAAEARESGKVSEWISEATTAAKEFGSILGNVGGIIGGVFRAGDGGSGLLANLDAMTERVRNFVNSTQGQDALARFFSSASQAASALAPVISAAFVAFTNLTPVIANIATGIGPGLAEFLRALGEQFAILAPAGLQLGTALGTALTAMIPMLPMVTSLVQAFVDMVTFIAPASPALLVLAGALGAVKVAMAITGTISAFTSGIAAVGGGLATATLHTKNFVAGLVSSRAASSAFTGRMGTMGGAIRTFIGHVVSGIAAVVRWTASIIAQAAVAAAQFIAAVARMIGQLVVFAAQMAANAARVVAGWVLMGAQSLIQAARMAAAWLIAMGPIGWAIAAIIGIAAIVIANWDRIKAVTIAAWNAISGAVTSAISRLMGLVRGIPGQISGALGNLGGLLTGAGRSIIQGLINGIKSMAGAVKGAVSGVLKAARNLLPFSPAKEGPFSGKGWTLYSGRSISESLAKGIGDQRDQVRKAALGLAEAAKPDLGALQVPGALPGAPGPAQGPRRPTVRPADLGGTPAGAGVTFQFTTYNPVEEPQSQTTNKALARVGALGMVG